MKLKFINPNDDTIATSNLHCINILFWIIIKIELKNKSYLLSFQRDALIVIFLHYSPNVVIA